MSSSIAQSAGVTMNGGGLSELWARLRFVLYAIIIYRIGTHIPVPGIDPMKLSSLFKGKAYAFGQAGNPEDDCNDQCHCACQDKDVAPRYELQQDFDRSSCRQCAKTADGHLCAINDRQSIGWKPHNVRFERAHQTCGYAETDEATTYDKPSKAMGIGEEKCTGCSDRE